MKKIIVFLLIFSSFFLIVDFAFAQDANKLISQIDEVNFGCLYYVGGDLKTYIPTIDCLPILFANLIYWLILLSGTVALIFVIFGGIKYLISGGDQAKAESAKKTLTWSIVGLIVILSSFFIVNLVADLTKINCLSEFGFTSCGNVGTNKPCNNSNPKGSCTISGERGQTCVEGACRWLCSSTHKGGSCLDNPGNLKKCKQIFGTSNWSCQLKCGTTKQHGFCNDGKKCVFSLENLAFVCKSPCHLARNKNGYCQIGVCTKNSTTIPPTWSCK